MPRNRLVRARAAGEPTDEELVEGIRRADQAAFNTLYERYFQRVYHFTCARIRNHADAEEVVQETFTAIFRSIGAYQGRSSLLSWIYGIARNTVNNHLRRTRTQEMRLAQAEPELVQSTSSLAHCTPEEQLSLQRSAGTIQRCLASVAEWQAEIFVLRHVENLPIAEISRRTQRSSDSVRSSLYRVKRLLVGALDADGGARLDGGLA